MEGSFHGDTTYHHTGDNTYHHTKPTKQYSKTPVYLSKIQERYLRELIGISFGLGMTKEVEDGLELINRTLEHKMYYEVDGPKFNKLQYTFHYKKNKGKHFL